VASQAADSVEPWAINTQNFACLSISPFFDDMHNTSHQHCVAATIELADLSLVANAGMTMRSHPRRCSMSTRQCSGFGLARPPGE
jgi:hypothetical protein